MSDLRIDYSELQGLVEEGARKWKERRRRRARMRSLPGRLGRRVARWTALLCLAAALPFVLLIRGGVFAYQIWGLGTWGSILVAMAATVGVLALYALVVGRWLGAGAEVQKVLTRAAMVVAVAWVGYGLVFIASENVKSDDVRAQYTAVHPLLRLATSSLVLADPASVITDAGRTAEDYWLMGLPTNEASLHFEQETGYVHALDLRTNGRSEVRNRLVELTFWALGFHSLRHVGTADHLHLSLRLPG